MRPAIVFDDGKGLLSPLTDLRAAFDIRTGALTTLDRYRRWFNVAALGVPGPLAALAQEQHPDIPVNRFDDLPDGAILALNGRAPLLADAATGLGPGMALLDPDGSVVAACVHRDRLPDVIDGQLAGISAMTASYKTASGAPAGLLSRPWHVRTMRDACLKEDLAWLTSVALQKHGWGHVSPGVLVNGTEPWFVHPDAEVFPSAFLDASGGSIFVDQEATVRPGAILIGPCYIGPHATVLDRAVIRPGTSIGPWCKVAGEVGGTIFQGYANKAHDGYLGDSFVGEWANLGAGTTNSNLLNTYGEIICRAFKQDGTPAPNERTGEQFLGAIIGDHAKFAICTRIMTGAIIGTGTMWAAAAAVTGTIPAYSWVTDAGTKPYRFEKFVEVTRTMMARRKVELGSAYLSRLQAIGA